MFTIALVGLTFPFMVMIMSQGLPDTALALWATAGIVAAWCVRALSFCAQDWWVGMMQSTIQAMQDGSSDAQNAPRRQWLLETSLLVACATGLVAPLVAALTIAGEWLDRRSAVQLAAMTKAFRSREEQ